VPQIHGDVVHVGHDWTLDHGEGWTLEAE
jgi:hypothetical protein